MKLRIVSDLHLHSTNDLNYSLPKLPTDDTTTLIIAGDLSNGFSDIQISWLKNQSNQFQNVIYVLGNHEYYNNDIATLVSKLDFEFKAYDNIHVLNGMKQIDDVLFIGCTLWTNFFEGDENLMEIAHVFMSDYRYIKYNNREFKPIDSYYLFKNDLDGIKHGLDHAKLNNLKPVVITHHAPSFKSVHPRFFNSEVNSAFYSNLDNFIENSDIKLWIHGHMHNTSDYNIGNTRIICNPKGHVGENPIYNPRLLINI